MSKIFNTKIIDVEISTDSGSEVLSKVEIFITCGNYLRHSNTINAMTFQIATNDGVLIERIIEKIKIGKIRKVLTKYIL